MAKPFNPDFSTLKGLTVKDYQRWLRKQIRLFGRRVELGDARIAPIESFMKEATGLDVKMLAGGEVEVYVGTCRYELFIAATDLAYYIYEDETNELITTAGKALDVALLVNPSLHLAA